MDGSGRDGECAARSWGMNADKRFHLFSWDGYESGGVADDYRGAFTSLSDAIAAGAHQKSVSL